MTIAASTGSRRVTNGDPVWIYACGGWRAGFVAKVGTSRLTCEWRSVPGHLHWKAVKPSVASLVRYRAEGESKP